MKLRILIFILALVGAGSVVAEEKIASSSARSVTTKELSITHQADQMFEHVIDERRIDRYVSFDRPDAGGSSRYSMSLDLEHEADDWNFEITVTIEF